MQGLRIFCDVADLRSFSRAAELHGITQSAVSQRIQNLEELFGTKLLDRSKRASWCPAKAANSWSATTPWREASRVSPPSVAEPSASTRSTPRGSRC
ncbi:MAG: LysR family transcriptional regulator [Acidobacteria bacterium]|nr:LysR family transcriptional regulator [Acidobacteriota bacterium]